MRSFGLIAVGAALLGLGMNGCGQPTATSCPRAVGTFDGQYSLLRINAGTCAPTFQAHQLVIGQNQAGGQSSSMTVGSLSDSVTTQINLVGCSVGMTQTTTDKTGAKMISQISGELQIEDESALSGTVSRTEYMPDGATVSCQGEYEATYTLEGEVVGAAAKTALAN